MDIRGDVSSEGAGEVVVGTRLCMSVALVRGAAAIVRGRGVGGRW
jgi:hypothetical protein